MCLNYGALVAKSSHIHGYCGAGLPGVERARQDSAENKSWEISAFKDK